MVSSAAFVTRAGLGAGLMYVLDPERGRRRRALARDKVVHVIGKSDDALGATARDMMNRARGVVAEIRSRLGSEKSVPDDILAERVRAVLGQYVSHPGAIEVSAEDGRVILRGVILACELKPALRAASRVRGVREVESRLGAHETPGDVRGLQGGSGRPGRHFELLQANWSPTARVLMGAAGATLLASAVVRRDTVSGLLGTVGLGVLTRAVTNIGLGRLAYTRAREAAAATP